jgi:hypothetical protein
VGRLRSIAQRGNQSEQLDSADLSSILHPQQNQPQGISGMSAYVYRVTKDTITLEDGRKAQVAVYAYKPTYCGCVGLNGKYETAEQTNRRWAFKSGCFAPTKIRHDLLITLSDDKMHGSLYENKKKLVVFYDDSTFGSEAMPRIGNAVLRGSKYIVQGV